MKVHLAVVCYLLILIAFVYSPTAHFGFVDYDDTTYIIANPHIQQGLSWPALHWACTTFYFVNWHPLTWISYILQFDAFKLNGRGYHLVNVVGHALATLLLYGWLFRATGRLGASAAVAAVFAVHPLHVESVAWVSEWKDVLSTLLLQAALWAYVVYVRAASRRAAVAAYAAVALFFALSLLSKQTYVTLPALLLLLDIWPLRRAINRWVIAEKLPLLLLAVGPALLASAAQRTGGAMADAGHLPFFWRLVNAIFSYVVYLCDLVAPVHLAVFYPYRDERSLLPAAAAGLILLLLVTVVARRQRERRPYLLIGWLWFLGMLLPTIGLVQVGAQARADRYTYFPSVGISVAVVWTLDELVRRPWARQALVAFAAGVVVALAVAARRQVMFWRDTQTLFQHDAEVEPNNWQADLQLGNVAARNGQYAAAADYFQQMIALHPNDARGYNNLANCLVRVSPGDAVPLYQRAVQLEPLSIGFRLNLATALERAGRAAAALQEVKKAAAIDPANPDVATAMQHLQRLAPFPR